jgi:hypothetical protein
VHATHWDESPDGWDADVLHAVGVRLAAGLRSDLRVAYLFDEPPVKPMFTVCVSFTRVLLLSSEGLIPGASQRATVWFHRLRMWCSAHAGSVLTLSAQSDALAPLISAPTLRRLSSARLKLESELQLSCE